MTQRKLRVTPYRICVSWVSFRAGSVCCAWHILLVEHPWTEEKHLKGTIFKRKINWDFYQSKEVLLSLSITIEKIPFDSIVWVNIGWKHFVKTFSTRIEILDPYFDLYLFLNVKDEHLMSSDLRHLPRGCLENIWDTYSRISLIGSLDELLFPILVHCCSFSAIC